MVFPDYRLLLPNAKRFPHLVPRNYLTTRHSERSASAMVYKRGDSSRLWLRCLEELSLRSKKNYAASILRGLKRHRLRTALGT